MQILQAVQVHRQDVVAVNPRKRRINQPVVENVAPHVLLEDDDRVHDLAQRYALLEPAAAPVGELRLHDLEFGSPIQLPR